ncbi:MAG: hypothetical protein C0501_01455 [Isosphaera sp.]|nr:hypothetical protein [Isosphaera sp.]
MRAVLIVGVLAGVAAGGGAAPLPADWALPKADGDKWVARVRKAVGRDGWSVGLNGNEITVRRDKPVGVVDNPPNGTWRFQPEGKADREREVRFVLRFAPKLSADEYDRLAAVNAASEKEADKLFGTVRDIPHKFDDFLAKTADEKERVRAYREAVAKLPHHDLPDLYTPDHSIFFHSTEDGWSHPADKDILAEVLGVKDTLRAYFGVYDPRASSGGWGFRPLPR